MRGSEAFFFFLMVFGFVGLLSWFNRQAKEREQRLKLLERALDKPGLDEETKRMLVENLRGPRWRSSAMGAAPDRHGRSWWPQLFVVLGWLGIFIGAAILVVGSRRDEEVGIAWILVSAGVLTLPFALKEFERRRPA
jgi:hypothetical protein